MNLLYFVSSLNFGGAEKQTVLDANLMAGEHQVHLVSFKEGPLNDILSDEVNFFQLDRASYWSNAKTLASYCRSNKIDIIHAALFAAFIISSLSTFWCKARVIWHFHSHEYDLPLKSKIVMQLCSRIPGVKKLAYVNKELIEYFGKYNFPRSKNTLLYNHSTIERQEFRSKENSKVSIGYLGRVIGLKRVGFLVDLAKALRSKGIEEFQIDIVGNGDQLDSLKKRISEEELTEYFQLHGFQTEVNRYYKTFDFFVNPSEEECLSIAMIDAGMHGLPIAAFDVGGNNEIIKHQETGFVVQTLEGFIESCFELVVNENLRLEMGKKSQEHCYQHFSEPVHRAELMDLYKEVLR